ncbi:unnamed protein product, partial [Coregonus sp. 'balchen']
MSEVMSTVAFQDLPLNIYMVIFGTGVFVFVLSLIFCCYFISKLRHQAQRERFGYKAVVFKGDTKKLNLHGQTCAVCLEDFRVKDELGHIAGPPEQRHSLGTLLDELV